MEATWYALIGLMLTVYVVLDGFDFGAGVLHRFVARNDEERRTVFAAIGPVWDGNEVWLIASGGVLVFAFPRAYAVAFSGFYLPLMLVLWLLILRGLSIELRSFEPNPLWRAFWDTTFIFSSTSIALVLGASFGNLVRGVPLAPTGAFHEPFFTDFRTGAPDAGALDWYTISAGVFAVVVLGAHGATYLAWKTDGTVGDRSMRAARGLWLSVAIALVPMTALSAWVQPALFRSLLARPAAWLLGALSPLGLALIFFGLRRDRTLRAFLGSSLFLVGLLGATAGAMYPIILRSTVDPASSVTALNASSGRRGLLIGLVWWTPAIGLAVMYFAYLFRSFSGKVRPSEEH
jgi:cytochrome d ubiquinol oxidase subunit II